MSFPFRSALRRAFLSSGLTAALLPLAYAQAPATAAFAEDDSATIRLENFVTTATRTEKALEKIPGAIEVITRRDLDTQLLIADDPSQALATFVPGFAPSRQKLTQTGETLRGRPILYLLDGIPQSNPLRSGMREGYFADPLIIDRIEVVSGANAIHGAGATGGIINYITKTARAEGTRQTFTTQAATQGRDDDLSWKAGYAFQHKQGSLDLLAFAGVQRNGMRYDADGRAIGIDTVQGDTVDSFGYDLFVKAGYEFGAAQRLQFSANRYDLEGDGDYRLVSGNRALGLPTTSARGTPPGMPARNLINTFSLDYTHRSLLDGLLTAQFFLQDFSSLYGATNTVTFQDTALAPAGTLYDQSEIVADKSGAKITYARRDTFVTGLELTGGLDWLNDNTRQRLAGTNRTWVPPLDYTSFAPFVQTEYERGPVTLRGGVRFENAELDVATYQTLAYYGRQTVRGGTLSFDEPVFNLGGIVRLGRGFSAFYAYTEGFGLPDVGLILRAVNQPDRSVGRLVALVPVLTKNNEAGLSWRGERGSASLSVYESKSDLSSVVRINNLGIGSVDRVPTRVRGAEFSGEWRVIPTVTLNATAALLDGQTAVAAGQPLDLDLGARNMGPNKLMTGVTWRARPDLSLRLQSSTFFDRDINIGRNTNTTRFEEHFAGYTLFDAAATWRTSRGTFGLGIENLLNRHYFGYYVQADVNAALSNDTYFAGRGRTLTLRYTLEF
ncbi:MAG: TonB-dependent receptor [Opitutus sp.]|nr:TonB-dependent receptor [Opitutus sp.]